MPHNSVFRKSWSELTTDEVYEIARLRTNVFYREQHVDDDELDGRDRESHTVHVWIGDERGAAAYLRVLRDAVPEHRDARTVIGRVVVRADRRGEGLAQLLMDEVLRTMGESPMLLHAQEYITPLYAKFGFVPFGEVYEEAGIPHLSMYRGGAASDARGAGTHTGKQP
ncbi:GNAT family N-acetyltransferase [Compostimonas suwonensis]|uniref:ElaA protein n=1 Tax=Compostimonas suwonensis TaxID=1048394 RepID=A0A2M9BVK7_9MICO|nr:GNAT family N-acetyltransferase [Compostimonas suwonensis]PJJ61965.1 ElaA protein [Compostimonas suwonensis]